MRRRALPFAAGALTGAAALYVLEYGYLVRYFLRGDKKPLDIEGRSADT